LGHSRPMHSAPVPANVRYAPLATKMVRRFE